MKRIDTIKWKEFKIKELFITEKYTKIDKVPTGASIPKRYLKEGQTPRISATNINNGILGFFEDVKNNSNYRIYENFISVSFLGTVFYHDYKASLDMKVHCLKLKEKELNKYIAFYLISIIRKVIERTEYTDQLSSTILPYIKINLPVDEDNNPDWEYMESFIKFLENKERNDLSNIINYLNDIRYDKVDTSKWKRFNLYDDNLFEIFSGNKLDKKNMTSIEPSINFIGRSSLDNGVTEKVDRIENVEPYKSGDMTLALGGHYLGSCFIQKEPFYTSQNVNVLRAKNNISFNCKLFISTMIFKESQLYYKAFVNELNRHINKDFSILLPIDINGKPDWNYMENFIEYKYKAISQMLNGVL